MMSQAVQSVLDDPITSTWLKDSLNSSLQRDPIDAAFDAEILWRVLGQRADEAIAESIPTFVIEDDDE